MGYYDDSYRHDAWRDSYDSWKLKSPYDDCDDGPECIHEEFDEDSEGRRVCAFCEHRWYPSAEEIQSEAEREREYAKWERQQQRKKFWHRWLRNPFYRLFEMLWPRRKTCWPLLDDEVPF
jgi:hypothetical protein